MKRIVKIFFAAALLLGAVSCTDLLDEALRGRGAVRSIDAGISEFPEGARVTLGFNVPMPVSTKAMTEEPTINSIHVFVFVDNGVSDNGVLFEVQKATLGGFVDKNAEMDYESTYGTDGVNGHIRNYNDDTVLARWQVSLLMSRTKRRLHFVANLPENFSFPEAGAAEYSVMHSIQTAGEDVAYWQMVELANGVLAYTYDGSGAFSYVGNDGTKVTQSVTHGGTDGIDGWLSYDQATGTYKYKIGDDDIEVAKGDYIATNGHKILDGKGFYASEELSKTVSMIPLIRNFARIKVITTSTSNFHLDSAVLVNVPRAGYAAPFDDRANQFVRAYRKADSTALSHEVIFQTGYLTSTPPDTIAIVTKCPEKAVKAATVNNRDTVLLYMYERGIPTQNPTSLLVKGSLNNNSEKRWFKIEIAGEDGTYFPIYRDFTYEVEIKSITGSDGYKTMEEAWKATAIGDISGSPETETLTQISDGNLTLWVEYIDKTSTESRAHSATLLYKFYDADDNLTEDNVTLTVVPVEGREAAIDTTASGAGSSSLTGAPYSGDGLDGKSGWYQVTVPLYGSGNEPKISTLHVEGTKPNGKTLYRNVTFRVMEKQDFLDLSATPLHSEAAGDSTTLTIELPPHLGYSVFPLTLMIEAKDNNLNPGSLENLSVESGTSLFGTGKNSFYFLKTISYSEYQNNRTYSVVLKTTVNGENTANGTNATTIAVTDKEGYFNTGTTLVSVGPAFKLSANTISVAANETSAKFTLFSTGELNPTWELSADKENVTFLPSNTGTGSKVITVGFPANATSSVQTYEIIAKRTGFDNQTFTITQAAPEFSLSASGTTIGPDATTVSFDITSTSNEEWTVTKKDEDDGITFGSAVTGRGNATITVNVPANQSSDQKTYTIYAYCGDFDRQEFTITQSAMRYYTINLDAGGNNATYGYPWVSSTVNPDSNSYYSYQSNNEGRANTLATMSVTIIGYTEFSIYIRSYAQSNRDYLVVRKIGSNAFTTWNRNSAYSDSGTKSHTRNNQQSGTGINSYTEVKFTTADGLTDDNTPHTFYIQFGKNGDGDQNDDRGYVLIPKTYNYKQ